MNGALSNIHWQGHSQDFHEGGAQLDGAVIGSPRLSRAWPA